VKINAVTCGIWDIDLQINAKTQAAAPLSTEYAEKILTNFITDIGIESNTKISAYYDSSTSPPSITAVQKLGNGACAIANITGRRTPDEESMTLIGLHIYLSLRTPDLTTLTQLRQK
jgi:hypothetical protein